MNFVSVPSDESLTEIKHRSSEEKNKTKLKNVIKFLKNKYLNLVILHVYRDMKEKIGTLF